MTANRTTRGSVAAARGGVVAAARGSATVEVAVVVGLLLVPFTVLVLSMTTWVERRMAATAAAAELARADVIGSGADSDAVLAAVEHAYAIEPGALRVGIDHSADGTQRVVTVSIELPMIQVPVLGPIGSQTWTARHVERVADYGAARP